eukprot:3250050-Amphidinium_carterae.1
MVHSNKRIDGHKLKTTLLCSVACNYSRILRNGCAQSDSKKKEDPKEHNHKAGCSAPLPSAKRRKRVYHVSN